MKKYKVIIAIIAFSGLTINSEAQVKTSSSTNEVEIGNPFPDYTFTDVDHYLKKAINVTDFRGKWLVLDYWSEWCGTCIASMPKMNAIQKGLKDKVQIIMVGTYLDKPNSNLATTRRIYEKVRKAKNLDLVIAYDTILATRLKVGRMPDILVIDPEGILRGRFANLTLESIKSITNGNIQEIVKELQPGMASSEKKRRDDNYNKNLSVSKVDGGNVRSDYIYRSIITPANTDLPVGKGIEENGRLEFINYYLKSLYGFAYFGHNMGWTYYYPAKDFKDSISQVLYKDYYNDPILEIKDSSKFISNNQLENRYCYSVCYPKVNLSNEVMFPSIRENATLRKNMQSDLKNTFGYNAKIEIRKKPYYRMVVRKDMANKLTVDNSNPPFSYKSYGRYKGGEFRNWPVGEIAGYITANCFGLGRRIVILDETNIKGNIDIDLKGGTLEEWMKSLRKNGLDLIPAEKDMKCLVISDVEPVKASSGQVLHTN
jgi:thiol-disulfide isomerase/thioredoxin